jgi:ubiquinone biosynthesis protein UbiJ
MGLIDDVIQTLGKDVSRIKARAQIMLKAYNLGQEIKDLQQQKTDALALIGGVIYSQYQQQIMPKDESLQQKCSEIAALEKDISHLQVELDSLKMQENSSSNEESK